MTTNVLSALINILNYGRNDIQNIYVGRNRANHMGDALEYFVKDAFCNTFNIEDLETKSETYLQYFSYLGNSNNPPDFIIRNGEAVEVKKTETKSPDLQLNSSYPKNKLYYDDSRITNSCRESDGGTWTERTIIYSMGYIKNNLLKELFFVDGECYAANREVYENVLYRAKKGIEYIFDESELYETKEIGRINKTDALGSAYLRVRPMWILKHPRKVFEKYLNINEQAKLNVVTILPKEKYLDYSNLEEFEQIVAQNDCINLSYVNIPNPNNPDEEKEVVIIHISLQ